MGLKMGKMSFQIHKKDDCKDKEKMIYSMGEQEDFPDGLGGRKW